MSVTGILSVLEIRHFLANINISELTTQSRSQTKTIFVFYYFRASRCIFDAQIVKVKEKIVARMNETTMNIRAKKTKKGGTSLAGNNGSKNTNVTQTTTTTRSGKTAGTLVSEKRKK